MEVRRIKDGHPCKGPTMKPAYEDVRVAPQNDLAQELMQCTLEGVVDTGNHVERGDQTNRMNEAPQETVSSLVAGIHKKSATDDVGSYTAHLTKEHSNFTAVLKTDRSRHDTTHDKLPELNWSSLPRGY